MNILWCPSLLTYQTLGTKKNISTNLYLKYERNNFYFPTLWRYVSTVCTVQIKVFRLLATVCASSIFHSFASSTVLKLSKWNLPHIIIIQRCKSYVCYWVMPPFRSPFPHVYPYLELIIYKKWYSIWLQLIGNPPV